MGRGRRADIRSAIFPSAGPNGTASIATASADSGKGTAARVTSSPRGWSAPAICTQWSGRLPYASINFITCHDGFSLQDLVSYNEKHNEANGEDNRDGANDNYSWNCGVEGPTDDAGIQAPPRASEAQLHRHAVALARRADAPRRRRDEPHASRQQQHLLPGQRADLARLGPGRREKQGFLDFVRKVARIWQEQPVFQRRKFFHGRPIRGSDIKDLSWFGPDGQEMSDEAWNAGYVKCLGVRLAGDEIGDLTSAVSRS